MANNNWNNYTEKTATPVDADEVMVRDSTDGKNKKLLFGTFWKWVAKKLNEATISELQTSNKTIVGALNQLNSDKLNNTTLQLNDNIESIYSMINPKTCTFFCVWGNIGGLYPSWAWGILMVANGVANFIGIDNVTGSLAIGQYANKSWKKIS